MTTATSSATDPASRPDTAATLGMLLARARQARGLEQREAAARLGLSPDIVRSLEEGNAHQVDAPVFVRGYLLRYARFLGLPEQEILERYRCLGISEQPPLHLTPTTPVQVGGRSVSRWFSYLLLLALLGGIAWVGLEQAGRQGPEALPVTGVKPPAGAIPSPPGPPPAIEPAGGPDGGQGRSTVATPTLPPPAPTSLPAAHPPPLAETPRAGLAETAPVVAIPTVSVAPAAAPPVATPAAADSPGAAPAALPPGHVELVLEFKGDSWVSIKDAGGQRLAYQTGKANSTSTFTGQAPFRIVLGNSAAVTIRLNGQTIDPAVYVKRTGPSQFVLDAAKPGA